jgi:hypothetical protein
MQIIAFNSENNIEQIRLIGGKFIFYVTSGTYIYHWDLNGKIINSKYVSHDYLQPT